MFDKTIIKNKEKEKFNESKQKNFNDIKKKWSKFFF